VLAKAVAFDQMICEVPVALVDATPLPLVFLAGSVVDIVVAADIQGRWHCRSRTRNHRRG
jgi:hypothetical protein